MYSVIYMKTPFMLVFVSLSTLLLLILSLSSRLTLASPPADYNSGGTDGNGRVRRGVILDKINQIIHPRKDDNSEFTNEKKVVIKTPLGSLSLSSSFEYQKPLSGGGGQFNPQGSDFQYHQNNAQNTLDQHGYPPPHPPTHHHHHHHHHELPAGEFIPPHHQYGNQQFGHQYPGQSSYPESTNGGSGPQFPVINENKEKDELDIVLNNNGAQDGLQNEGGNINVVKKETGGNTNNGNTNNGNSAIDSKDRVDAIIDDVFGKPNDTDVSGDGKIDVRFNNKVPKSNYNL